MDGFYSDLPLMYYEVIRFLYGDENEADRRRCGSFLHWYKEWAKISHIIVS